MHLSFRSLSLSTNNVDFFQKKIVSLSPSLADRVAEFNRREGERKSLLASISSLAEKVCVKFWQLSLSFWIVCCRLMRHPVIPDMLLKTRKSL